ncbi:uncharacterized protein znf518a isoform 1-T2 [Odontesthes bonariensis]|uniref:uncharacterized protein znf518a n=1 Tax=Odontesthes bonariensis TaxID=219752 RepID=UPI003F585666
MDLVDICAATSTGGGKRRFNAKNRNWHKRLHLRKTAVQPPAMQNEDKNGPKKIAEEWEQTMVWPSSKKPRQEAQQSRRVTNDRGNALRFTCSQCKDNSEYAPKDLARHFEEKHRGSPPVFSCHMCSFGTHEFSYLQVHLLSHEDTFSSCSLCHDNVQRTWPEFSAHLTMHHCPNGKYLCEICRKFSTAEVAVFLEHVYGHNFEPDGGGGGDHSLHKKVSGAAKSQLTASQTLRCQHCGFEASQKWLITKHVKAVHVCQNGNQRKKKREGRSIAIEPSDTIPRMSSRLTRSAVREMCWLTQDCLSLPGREFLDKYCHLSDPQTTLEETQQFLMKSVAGETDDQKWTKALKSVLSNVPQDMSLHPKSENGIASNPSELAVLTVKNKITVAPNGATYAKRLRTTAPGDRETPESAAGDSQCAADQNGRESNLKDQTSCPQAESKLHNDSGLSVQNEPSQRTGMQENRENHELEADRELEGHGKKPEGPVNGEGNHISGDPKSTNECEEKTSVRRASPRTRRPNRRRRRKSRFKKAVAKSKETLKIVLKKNPVKEKQWVSESPPSASEEGLPNPPAVEEMVQALQNVLPKNQTKGSPTDPADPSEAITLSLQSGPVKELALSCSVKPTEPEHVTGSEPATLRDFAPPHEATQGDAEKPPLVLETEADAGRLAAGTSQTNPRAEEEMCRESEQLQQAHSGADCLVTDDQNQSPTADGGVKSPPVPQPGITPQGKTNTEDSSPELPAQQSDPSVERTRDGEVPADSCPNLLGSVHLPAGKAIQQEPAPAPGHLLQPAPKHQERTLKLVAINPAQLVKRPAGDQPVVVLNHPDADIPQVARIMEVVSRHREVQRVVLSRRTLNALTALDGDTDEPTGAPTGPAWRGKNSVQERFTLKLKLRRLSRKKYEIVGAVSPDGDFESKFPCWFCGRVFTRQETVMAHQQRHLMEWKRPNCENS